MSHRLHDDVAWLFAMKLRFEGQRIATEVGVPGGRIDLVRLDTENRWVELYEVKVRAPEAGLGQLATYARHVPIPPRRTLVVPPELDTADLRTAAKETGTRLLAFDYRLGVQLSLRSDWDYWVHLPYIHPETTARVIERWAQERRVAA